MTDAPQSRRARRAAEDEAADRGIDGRTLGFARGVATGEIPAVGVDGAALTRKDRRRLERLASPMETWTAEEERLATGQIPVVSPEVISREERAARERAEAAARDAYLHSQEFRRVAEREVRPERRDDFGGVLRDEPRHFERPAAPGPDAVTDASRLADRDAFGGATPFSASQLFAAAPPRGSAPHTGSAATLGPRYDEPPTDARFPEEVAPRRAENFEAPATVHPRDDAPEFHREPEPEPRREPEPTPATSAVDEFDETVRYPSHYQTPPAWALERPADEQGRPRWVEPAQQGAPSVASYDAPLARPADLQPAADQPFDAAQPIVAEQPFEAAQPFVEAAQPFVDAAPATAQPPADAPQSWDAGAPPQAQPPAPEWAPEVSQQAQAPEPAPARGLPMDWFPPGSLQAASAQAAVQEVAQPAAQGLGQDAAPADLPQQPFVEQPFAAQHVPALGGEPQRGGAPTWPDSAAASAQPSADAAWAPADASGFAGTAGAPTDAPAADPAEEIRRLAAEAMNNLERAAEQSSPQAEAPVARYGDLGGGDGAVGGQVSGETFPADVAQPQPQLAREALDQPAAAPQQLFPPAQAGEQFGPAVGAPGVPELGAVAGLAPLGAQAEAFAPTQVGPVPASGAIPQAGVFAPATGIPASGAIPQAGVFAPTTGSNPQAGVFAPATGAPASGAIALPGSQAPTTALPQARPVTGAIPYAELTPTGQLAALRRAELPDKPDPKTFAWPHLGVIAALMVVLGVVIYNVAFGS